MRFLIWLIGISVCLATSAESIAQVTRLRRVAKSTAHQSTDNALQNAQPESSVHSVDAQAAAKADASVERQVQSLQQNVQREEQRLQSRLAQLNKLRDAALKKNSEQDLKRIEQMEQAAIKEYEQRVARILGAASNIKPSEAPLAKSRNTKSAPKPKPNSKTRATSAPQRRRFWLWGR
jgi:parvulin-like peptidyl-prolyl isomerase